MSQYRYILTDACFWIGVCDSGDKYSDDATEMYEKIKMDNNRKLIIPWPIMYEVLATKSFKRKHMIYKFKDAIDEKRNVEFILDEKYRKTALIDTFENATKRKISLVDTVMRNMLVDSDVHFDALITFNYEDFVDICTLHKIPICNTALEIY